MSSPSDASLIAALGNASVQLNRYFGLFIIAVGLLGNTMNTCVLSQKALRSNPCAWLFLTSSIAYGIGLAAGMPSRPLSTWNADLTNESQFLCKLRAILLFTAITIGSWLVMLATIDRWLSSHPKANLRQKSTLKNAQIGAFVIITFITLAEAQHAYCFEANLTNAPLKCYTSTVWCSILSDLSLALLTVLFPLIVMVIFGCMSISNIRKSRSRLGAMNTATDCHTDHSVTAINTGYVAEQRKTDRRLSIMLFTQVLLICILTFPLAVIKLYSTITRSNPKTSVEKTIENFAFSVCLLVFYLYCGMPFYIYALSGGRVFRKAIISFLTSLRQVLMFQCAQFCFFIHKIKLLSI